MGKIKICGCNWPTWLTKDIMLIMKARLLWLIALAAVAILVMPSAMPSGTDAA